MHKECARVAYKSNTVCVNEVNARDIQTGMQKKIE